MWAAWGRAGQILRLLAQAAVNCRRNSSMCGKFTLLAPYFIPVLRGWHLGQVPGWPAP